MYILYQLRTVTSTISFGVAMGRKNLSRSV